MRRKKISSIRRGSPSISTQQSKQCVAVGLEWLDGSCKKGATRSDQRGARPLLAQPLDKQPTGQTVLQGRRMLRSEHSALCRGAMLYRGQRSILIKKEISF